MPTLTATSERPAILDGPPAVTLDQTEALRWPVITADEEQAVLAVLRSGRLSIHETVAALEKDVREWLDIPFAVAHCNGTSAILA
ncbi:MAG: DegT/DnrJ/EryC1/StrS family aminotransferase, partial [Planctomycetota bacterium]